jgi:ribosomal protein S18 acetylase RimI-like enzyme
MSITYQKDVRLTVADIIRVFDVSGIKRPTHDKMRIEQMFANSNLVFSAWDGEKLIGICRCLTDFNYACYLSDLAVDKQYQSQGVGKELIQKVREDIGKKVSLILLSAPTAMHYYPKIGFAPIDNGFVITREQ